MNILIKTSFFIQEFQNTLQSIIRIIIETNWQIISLCAKPSKIKKCIILGNGPSLNKDLEKYPWVFDDNNNVWCVNNFAATEHYKKIKPQFYFFVDPIYWLANPPETYKKLREDLVELISRKTEWKLQIFLPIKAKKITCWKKIKNKNIEIRYYNNTPIVGFQPFRHWCYKYQIGMPPSHNVLIGLLTQAIHIGFNEIFIMGADHSFHETIHVEKNNYIFLKEKHFYGKGEEKRYLMHGYWKGQFYPTIAYLFDFWGKVFKGHEYVQQYASSRNVKITNLTEESYIDAYKRGSDEYGTS